MNLDQIIVGRHSPQSTNYAACRTREAASSILRFGVIVADVASVLPTVTT